MSIGTWDILDCARFETGPEHLELHHYSVAGYTELSKKVMMLCNCYKFASFDKVRVKSIDNYMGQDSYTDRHLEVD